MKNGGHVSGVVTPRDVISMLTRAIQWQRDELRRDPSGDIERLISGSAIIYGHEEMSKEKRTNYLEAEFPHKWGDIKKLLGGGPNIIGRQSNAFMAGSIKIYLKT
jgi:hypothetical protein